MTAEPAVGTRGLAGRTTAARRPARPQPVRRAAARRPGPAEHQREPLPAAARAGRRADRGGRRGGRATCTATPTATPSALRGRPRRLPRAVRTGVPLGVANVWAANGCNEVLQQLAAGLRRAGPDRAGLRRRPTRCTRSSPPAPAPSGSTVPRRPDFSLDCSGRRGDSPRPRARTHVDHQPEQPDRPVAAAGRPRGPVTPRRAWSSWTRPTASSPTARARSGCSTRTPRSWSSAAR